MSDNTIGSGAVFVGTISYFIVLLIEIIGFFDAPLDVIVSLGVAVIIVGAIISMVPGISIDFIEVGISIIVGGILGYIISIILVESTSTMPPSLQYMMYVVFCVILPIISLASSKLKSL